MMRAAHLLALCLCTAWPVAISTAQQPPAEPIFVKLGAELRDNGRVIDASAVNEPLEVLEERETAVRVSLKDGNSGWIPRSQIGTLGEVLKDASQRIAQQPDDVELRFYRVQLLARRSASGDREQALADLEQAVRLAPKDPRGYLARGSLWAKARQFEAAIDDFTQSLKLDATLSPALLERGLAHYAVRDFDAALADLDAYVRLKPNAAMGYTARAMTRVELMQYDQAEADFTRSMKIDDQSPLPWFERARMWMRRHDAPAAVSDLSQTLKRDPKHLDATIFLATLLACGPDDTPRDGKRAVELATTACKLAGDSDFRPIEALAAAHAETGDFRQAIEQQEKALAILEKARAADGAKAAARMRLGHYKASQPVRLMR